MMTHSDRKTRSWSRCREIRKAKNRVRRRSNKVTQSRCSVFGRHCVFFLLPHTRFHNTSPRTSVSMPRKWKTEFIDGATKISRDVQTLLNHQSMEPNCIYEVSNHSF